MPEMWLATLPTLQTNIGLCTGMYLPYMALWTSLCILCGAALDYNDSTDLKILTQQKQIKFLLHSKLKALSSLWEIMTVN